MRSILAFMLLTATVAFSAEVTFTPAEIAAMQGDTGPSGPSGQQGAAGIQGPSGLDGLPGIPGSNGVTGPQGANGVPGPQGSPGIDGTRITELLGTCSANIGGQVFEWGCSQAGTTPPIDPIPPIDPVPPIDPPATVLKAFPGAEGFGSDSIGGRGGQVLKVTNLNDNGPGSFRAAVTASGPRIVVFDVSGIINLASTLNIYNDNLTIAGQTSPGGILVTGYMTKVQASNVIVRYMRFRVGSHRIANGANPEQLDSFDIWGDPNGGTKTDIIIDHSSFGWGVDENISTAYDVRRVTIQDSLIAEGLSRAGHPKGEHSKGLFIWAQQSPDLQVSLLRNFMANNKERNPLINTGNANLVVDSVNNVTYNFFGGYAMGATTSAAKLNWRHNYSKGGPISNTNFYEIFHESHGTPTPNVFVEGNIGGSRQSQGGSEWTVADSWRFQLAPIEWSAPIAAPANATVVTMTAAYADQVVANAGATKPFRDSADQKVADDFANGTGGLLLNVSYPADFPTYQNIAPPIDSDSDGMPDIWEGLRGLDINIDDSAGDYNGDGYTNVEEYINGI